MEVVYYATCRTSWVSLLVASSAQGLVAVRFIPRGKKGAALAWLRKRYPGAQLVHSPEVNRKAIEELARISHQTVG